MIFRCLTKYKAFLIHSLLLLILVGTMGEISAPVEESEAGQFRFIPKESYESKEAGFPIIIFLFFSILAAGAGLYYLITGWNHRE